MNHRSLAMAPMLALFIATASGCDAFAYRYSYRGKLRLANGQPAASAKLFVLTPDKPHGFSTEDDSSYFTSEDDRWRECLTFGVITNRDGEFAGVVNSSETYVQFLGFPAGPPSRMLPGIKIYVLTRNCRWSRPIYVPLSPQDQKRTDAGIRYLDLPPITLPPEAMGTTAPCSGT